MCRGKVHNFVTYPLFDSPYARKLSATFVPQPMENYILTVLHGSRPYLYCRFPSSTVT